MYYILLLLSIIYNYNLARDGPVQSVTVLSAVLHLYVHVIWVVDFFFFKPVLTCVIFIAKLWVGGGKQQLRSGGGGSGKRVLCLHGLRDNCASFDRLIPLLGGRHDDTAYLCIDWPNHGLSSGTPVGARWTLESYATAAKRVADHVRWSTFACIGHSMGGQVAKLFAAVYPEHVEKLVMLDTAGPPETYPGELAPCMREALDALLQSEDRKWTGSKRPPEYACAEVALDRVKRRMLGSLTDDAGRALMTRYVRPAGGGKYVPVNDVRLKVPYSEFLSAEQHRDVVRNVRCPTLCVRATESEVYYTAIVGTFGDLYRTNPNFRTVVVEGTHDVHMNYPHRVAPFVNAFLNGVSSKL